MKHNPVRWMLVLLVTLLAVGVPLGGAAADVGPKPTIEFSFTQGFEGQAVTIVSGILMQCDQPDCSDAKPLGENMGPQHFTCETLSCSGLAYGFTDYGRIDITFSDGKLRRSNAFAINDFNAAYDVTILEDDLLVEEKFSPAKFSLAGLVVVALCLCLVAVVIAIIVTVVARIRQDRAKPAVQQ